MDVAEEELYKKSNDLVYEMTDFDVQDINTETVADYKERLSVIKNVHKDLVTAIQNLLHDYSDRIDSTKSDFWKQQINKLQADVRGHRDRIMKRVTEVKTSMPNTLGNLEAEKLDLQRRQVEAAEAANQTALDAKADLLSETMRETEAKRLTAVSKAKAKYSAILDDIKDLEEKVNEVEDWSKESELSIGRAMRNVKIWKEELQSTWP